MEAKMNIRLGCCTLIVGALAAVAAPPAVSMAQSNDQSAAVPKSATPNKSVSTHKDRYWRHRGGRHPHYGSRRVRAHAPAATLQPPAK
jgi:hypothetical protein